MGAVYTTSLTRTTQDGTTTYTKGSNTNGSTTTVVDPGKNKTVYYFTNVGGAPVITEMLKYQNTGTVGSPVDTLLTTDVICYNNNQTNCPTTLVSYPITQRDIYHTISGMSTSSRTTMTYDSYGNVTAVAKYGFGDSSFTTKTITTYGSWNGTTCGAISNSIHDRPCDVQSIDNASHTLAESRFTYNATGNVLTSSRWTGSTWISTTFVPNPNGTVASSTDPSGMQTTYSYAATGSGGCNGLLLTGTSATPNTGDTLTTSTSWDCNEGVVLSKTDANGKSITTSYDAMARRLSVQDESGYLTSLSYTGSSVMSSSAFDTFSTSTTTTVDGLGRSILAQTTDGSSYDSASKTYSFSGPDRTVGSAEPCSQPLGNGCAIQVYSL